MVNDISGLRHDPRMAGVVAKAKVPVCLMHIQGTPQTMQKNTQYTDLIGEIIDHLNGGLAIARKAGILLEKIIVDPGIGFGKTAAQNLEILRRLREFRCLGRPILVGTSRKSVIGQVLGLPVEERLEGTAATVALAINNGADLVRVHDVREMVRVVKMSDAIIGRR
jgi:dihydropteroate synthase